MGIRCLDNDHVRGLRREPVPPASIIPFLVIQSLVKSYGLKDPKFKIYIISGHHNLSLRANYIQDGHKNLR